MQPITRILNNPDEPAGTSWLFFLYLNGDNNLEGDALDLIHSLESLQWNSQPVRLLILLDRSPFYSEADGDWEDTRLFSVNTDLSNDRDICSVSLWTPSELNLGDPEVLREFLLYGMEEFPSKHYGLIIWDHGDGWRGSWGSEDPLLNDRLETRELGQALEGLELDVVCMDYSQGLGAMLEVAYEVRNSTQSFIGSQNEDPRSWNYGEIFTSFFETDFSPGNFHASVLDCYRKEYQEIAEPRTLSILDCTAIDELHESLNQFCAAAEEEISSAEDQQKRIEGLSEEVENFCYTPGDVNLDLRSMAQWCSSEITGLEQESERLIEAVDGAVLDHWEQPGFYSGCGGVSVFVCLSNDLGEWLNPGACGYFPLEGQEGPLAFTDESAWPGLVYRIWEKEF